MLFFNEIFFFINQYRNHSFNGRGRNKLGQKKCYFEKNRIWISGLWYFEKNNKTVISSQNLVGNIAVIYQRIRCGIH